MKKKFFAIVLVAAMLMTVTTGCGGGQAGDSGSAGDGDRVLHIRKTTSLVSTDWEKVTSTEDMPIVWTQVFQGLYGMNEAEGGYCNELAEEVQISEDGLTYTIPLVEATFQNGDAMKASDVVFSYKRAMENPRFNYVTAMIDEVEAVDDQTVQMILKYPYSAISHTLFSIKISSEREVTEAGAQYGTKPHTAATGPYAISEYNPSSGLKLTAYENYWEGAPNIKEVEYIIITEDSAAVIAYENGELDYMTDAPTAEWEALEAASNGNNEILKGNNIRMVCINYQSPVNNGILADPLVRQAIMYAIDKESVNMVATNGLGAVTAEYMPSSYVSTAPIASEGKYETYEYNPEKAKALLLQAGYTEADLTKGINVGTLTTYGSATGEKAKAAQVVQANLKAAGMICEVEVADIAIISPRLHSYDYDLCIFGDSGNFDFNNIRQMTHSESVGMDVVRYKSDDSCLDWKHVEELLDQGVASTDVEQRRDYYTELWGMVMDSATILPYLHMPVGVVWTDELDPGKLCPTYYHIYDFSWKNE